MFSGIRSSWDRWELAPSTTMTMNSSGCAWLTCTRNWFICSVFICGLIFQSSSHRSQELRMPENIRLHRLPGYSPELNPQEHVWDELREKEFPNRVFESMEAVISQ